jgi:hypothetical protein
MVAILSKLGLITSTMASRLGSGELTPRLRIQIR